MAIFKTAQNTPASPQPQSAGKWGEGIMCDKESTLRLILRSVYLKGITGGNLKTADMSWEDKVVDQIKELVGIEDNEKSHNNQR